MKRVLVLSTWASGAFVCCTQDSTGLAPGKAQSDPGKSYVLEVKAPPKVALGGFSMAEVSVIPQGEYKMNLDFPLKFSVKSPTGGNPPALEMKAKDATTLTMSRLVLRPKIKLEKAGRYTFQGILRFSVCTKKQCEMKTEQVKWVAESQ